MWWCVPLIPATQEAQVGELSEPRCSRPAWATQQDLLSKKERMKEKHRKWLEVYKPEPGSGMTMKI